MGATIEIHRYDESMDDEVLKSIGVIGGPLSQLATEVAYQDETDLLNSTEKYAVGETTYEFVTQLSREIDGITEVDSAFLARIQELAETAAEDDEGRYDAEETIEWLEQFEGESIFTVAL